jgi:hypothetical protein
MPLFSNNANTALSQPPVASVAPFPTMQSLSTPTKHHSRGASNKSSSANKKRHFDDLKSSPPSSPLRAQQLASNSVNNLSFCPVTPPPAPRPHSFPVTPPPAPRPQSMLSSNAGGGAKTEGDAGTTTPYTRVPALEPTLAQSAIYDPVLASLNKFENLGCCHDGTQTSLYGELTPRCVRIILELFRKYGMRGVFDVDEDNSNDESITTSASTSPPRQPVLGDGNTSNQHRFRTLDTFLDIGCGLGKVVFAASVFSGVRAYGVEIVPSMVRVARLVSSTVLKPLRGKERQQRRMMEKSVRDEKIAAAENERKKKAAEVAVLPSLARVGGGGGGVGGFFQGSQGPYSTFPLSPYKSNDETFKRRGSLVTLSHLPHVTVFTPMRSDDFLINSSFSSTSSSSLSTTTTGMMSSFSSSSSSLLKKPSSVSKLLDFSKVKMEKVQGDDHNVDDDHSKQNQSVTAAVAAAIAAAVANSRSSRTSGVNQGGGGGDEDESLPSPPRIARVKPLTLTSSLPTAFSQHPITSSSSSSSSSSTSIVSLHKKAKRQGGDIADIVDENDHVPSPVSPLPHLPSSSLVLPQHPLPVTQTPSKRSSGTASYSDCIVPGWQEEEAEEDSEVEDRLESDRAWRVTPPPPSFCLADASMTQFWTENLNKFTHIYAFDPAFPGKDLLPPGAGGPIDDGVDVLGGIARGLNLSSSWKVFISFQPPRVWQRKGLQNARCVQRITQMSMRVSNERKTCYVYLKDESCGDVIQIVEDTVSWRN